MLKLNELPGWIEVLTEQDKRLFVRVPVYRLRTDVKIQAYRDGKSYGAEDLSTLKTSILREGGLLNNPHCYLSEDRESIVTAGGNRRVAALGLLVADKSWEPDHPVEVYLYRDETRREILKVATGDNSNRKDFTDIEHYHEIVELNHEGFADDEIAAMKGWDKRKVERFISIKHYPILEKMLEDEMPYSKLAVLAEKIGNMKNPANRSASLHFLGNWVNEEVPQRKEVKKKEAAANNKNHECWPKHC